MTAEQKPEEPWCVYVTTFPNGLFYVGKSYVKRILKDGYQGSGTRFQQALEWYVDKPTTEIIATFEKEADAYKMEAFLVNPSLLKNSMCLNWRVGGDHDKRTCEQRAAAAGKPSAYDIKREKKRQEKILFRERNQYWLEHGKMPEW